MQVLKIYSTIEVDLFIDLKYVAKVPKSTFQTVPLEPGQYFVRFTTSNPLLYVEEVITVDKDLVIQIDKNKLLSKLTDTNLKSLTLIHKSDAGRHWIEELQSGLQLSDYYDQIGKYKDGMCVVWKNNHCGFIDMRGDEIIECRYDNYGSTRNGLLTVKLNKKWGAVNNRGDVIIAFLYDFCKAREDCNYWDVSRDGEWKYDLYGPDPLYSRGKWGICDNTGSEVIACQFLNPLSMVEDHFVGYSMNGPQKIYSLNGDELFSNIQPEKLQPIEGDSLHFEIKKDSKWGIIDINGNVVVRLCYDYIKALSELYIVKKDGKWGVINKRGDSIQPCIFDSIEKKSNFYEVKLNDKYGLLDRNAKLFVQCEYDYVDPITTLTNIIVQVGLNGKRGILDNNGILRIPIQYDYISVIGNRTYICKRNDKYGILDDHGCSVVPFIYDSMSSPYDSVLIVSVNNRFGLITKTGASVTGLIYEDICYKPGIGFWTKFNDAYGALNSKGQTILPFKYFFIDDSTEFRYPVNAGGRMRNLHEYSYKKGVVGGKWGFIDFEAKEIVPCQFDACSSFENGCAVVAKDDKMGVIDVQGNLMVPMEYSFCDILSSTVFLVARGSTMYFLDFYTATLEKKVTRFRIDMYGLADGNVFKDTCLFAENGKYGIFAQGQEIVPSIYDKIMPVKNETLFIVKKNDKYGLYDISGKMLIAVEYDSIAIV